MKIFHDRNGQIWQIDITAGTIRRVMALTGVNIDSRMRDGTIYETLSDIVTFVNILYATCKPEADARGVSDETFGELLAGDCISEAVDAFIDAAVDFTPSATIRTATRKAVEMTRTSQRSAEAKACAEMLTHLETSLSGNASNLQES